MTFFRDLLWKIQGILLLVWYLFVALLFIILLPFLIFLLREKIRNLDFCDIADNAALKLLKIIWHVLKVCFFIVLTLVLIPLTPLLIFWAWLCGNLWAWTVSGGKPTLETKKLVFSILGLFGFFLMIIFGILGLVISCLSGEFLASLIGGVGGFFIFLYPTVDCFDLEKKIGQELDARR